MNLSFLSFGIYTFFVWAAFTFTFLCCAYLFFKTKKELIKQENMFSNELKALELKKVSVVKINRKRKRIYQLS
tara:strand:+ start:438 stop:656 length:219 start_codon:yes stop_codon:yes gene_type:complete